MKGAKVAPSTANERCARGKDTGTRRDMNLRGRRLRRLVLKIL